MTHKEIKDATKKFLSDGGEIRQLVSEKVLPTAVKRHPFAEHGDRYKVSVT